MTQRSVGYYWIKAPSFPPHNREYFVAFYDGVCWYLNGDERQWSEELFAERGTYVVAKLNDPE